VAWGALRRAGHPWLAAVRTDLERQRLAAQLDRNDLVLRYGGDYGLLAGLGTATAAHPLDERLAGQLMLALYRGGRQADALEHYEQLRRRLAGELGADPGPALRRLHHQIVKADPVLTAPESAARSGPQAVRGPVPRQLPAPPRAFTGRDRELARLHALLVPAGDRPTVAISAVSGTAGIGKPKP